MGRKLMLSWLVLLVGLALPGAAAQADPLGMEHLHYAAGPYTVTPGANLILLQYTHVPKPSQDGFITRMSPNLRYAQPNGKCCGKVPRVDVIHLHHGVWLSNGTAGEGVGSGYGGFYPFMATGEEKTIYELPPGYGYPVGAHDYWVINYMIHNLTATPAKVYITYDLDFVPSTAPAAKDITPVHPIWMDVERGSIYPVFNVLRHSGVKGRFTFPDMARNPYPSPRAALNELTVTHPGTLIATAGHVHPGGLYTDLDLIRQGATSTGGTPAGLEPNSVRLFRSTAHYFDRRGPISWDMAMGGTPQDWRPAVKPGDVLRVSATYDAARASWYESMGIMVVWEAYDDPTGVDPFTHRVDETGALTHGHLPENDNHGGAWSVGPNMARFPACPGHIVSIAGFTYLPGDLTAKGPERCIPTVHRGHSLKFVNEDASAQSTFGNLISPNPFYLASIFHTITACQAPCSLNTGISYPLANGAGGYDSGELGLGTPGNGYLSWSTPANLKPGTYTFYCRIHPFMRGVFRVVG